MDVTAELKAEMKRVVSGKSGESEFLNRLVGLETKPKIITDFRFMYENSECQIDCLFIYSDEIVIAEVKNYQSDFYFEAGRWFLSGSGKEVSSPLEQANRAARMLRNMLSEARFRIAISEYLVFINKKFVLYGAPRDARIIFPNRVDQFLDFLDKKRDYPSARTNAVERALLERRLTESRYGYRIKVTRDQIRNGVTCSNSRCRGFMEVKNRRFICRSCGSLETMESAVIRMTRDFKALFKEDKITVPAIEEWMDYGVSIRTLQRILAKNFEKIGNKRSTEYIIGKNDNFNFVRQSHQKNP